MENGALSEEWALQCKHYTKWTKKQTQAAITACKYPTATHKFLLVTCDVGENCREIVAKTGDWTLWDGREITQQFLSRLSQPDAAAILYRCFGPGWDTKFVSVPGTGPLLTPDAFFKPWRRDARYFHHNLPLVGRADRLKDLDTFVNDRQRVLLLTGRGGLGKSRLLAAWSERFARQHPDVLLRFASRKAEDFERFLPANGERMVVVLDDAHQETSLRGRLFDAAARLDGVQIVIALRPGPNEAVRQELYSAGYDITDIRELPPLGRLSDDDAYRLAESALGPKYTSYAPLLYEASRDCPLIAVIGGALIQSGEATFGQLGSHENIRSAVFGKLEEQACRAESEGFQRRDISDFLALVSLLSPVANDAAFRDVAAEILGGSWNNHRIAALIQTLEGCGVLLIGSSGLRITPDLYSDDITYRACYDQNGKATGFVREILNKFGDKALETVARHLAEAEWRARIEHKQPDSIIEPIIDLFRAKFLSGSFLKRAALLERWGQIAVLRPRETLDFVGLAISEKNAPSDNDALRFGGKYGCNLDSYANVIDHLPSLLKAVGSYHKEYTGRALTLLWQLAQEKYDTKRRKENHPLAVMASISGYEPWKPVEICETALDWSERFFSGTDWLAGEPNPAAVLQVLLKPYLSVWVDATFWMRRKAVLRILPVALDLVRGLRDRVLGICRTVLARGDPKLSLAVLGLADEVAGPLHPPYGGDTSPALEALWLPERQKGLSLFADVLRSTPHLFVQLSVRRELLEHLRRESTPELIIDCKRILTTIPDHLDMHVMRALYSCAPQEFGEPYRRSEHDIHNRMAREMALWDEFITMLGRELVVKYSTADELADYLDRIAAHANEAGSQSPNFRRLLTHVVTTEPVLGEALAEYILSHPSHRLSETFDLLVHQTSMQDPIKRLNAYRRALAGGIAGLCTTTIQGLSWWRSEETLPDEAWELVESAAASPLPEIVYAVAGFVESHTNHGTERDLALLRLLPMGEEHLSSVTRILNSLGELISKDTLCHDPETITSILAKLVPLPELDSGRIEHELSQLAEHAPGEVFSFFCTRYFLQREGNTPAGYECLPHWAERLPLRDLSESPGYSDMVIQLGERLLTHGEQWDYPLTQLLRTALFAGNGQPEMLLGELLKRVDTEEKMSRLLTLLVLAGWSMVLAYPLWAKACLLKAHEFGPAVYDSVRAKLVSNCFASGRGFTNGEPDKKTQGFLKALENLSQTYASDSELGSLFTDAVAYERDCVERNRAEFRRDMEEE